MASGDRSHDQSWYHATDHTIKHGVQRPIVRSIVASGDGSHDQSWHLRPIVRLVVGLPPVVKSCNPRSSTSGVATSHDWWYEHAIGPTYPRPVTIWNRRLEVLNMTIDLAATDFALAMTHDLCDQWCVRFTIFPRFQHFSVAATS